MCVVVVVMVVGVDYVAMVVVCCDAIVVMVVSVGSVAMLVTDSVLLVLLWPFALMVLSLFLLRACCCCCYGR